MYQWGLGGCSRLYYKHGGRLNVPAPDVDDATLNLDKLLFALLLSFLLPHPGVMFSFGGGSVRK